MAMFRRFSPPFNPDICLIVLTSEVNVTGELRESPGNLRFGPAPRVQKFNLQTGQGSAGRRHCPAVERVGGFDKLTIGKAY